MTNRRSTLLAAACVTLLALAVGTLGLVGATRSTPARVKSPRAYVHPKGDAHLIAPGRNREAMVGANELRNPDDTPDIEAYLQRAYPADEISMDDTIAAQNAWAEKEAEPSSPGAWRLIGPSTALVPGVLNVLGDNAPYVTSGRVTAMAIGPTCQREACPVYVAAAGGGIWRTGDALAENPRWQFVSGSFATNAIGSLILDPNDTTGKTLYAGTGEPNVSFDSEAGMGIYKSTNGGTSWTLLPGSSQFQGRAVGSLAIAPDGSILAGIARATRGISSTSGGTTSNPPGGVAFGVYKSTNGGATFTNVSGPLGGTLRGMTKVAVDPNNGLVYYANSLGAGIWRSSNAGATWTQIKNPLNSGNNTDRAEFSLAKLGAATRMYVGDGAAPPAIQARFYRTDNAQTALDANFINLTTSQNRNYCTGQCWYDNVVYSPPGYPDVVYLLGSFDYNQDHGKSNARAVLLSTDAGATWSDLTQDSRPQHANFTHPDQHAIVVNPNNPFQYWEGSDGGVVRSDGQFADVSYKCDQRGLTPADNAYCKSLLNRVPRSLAQVNIGLSTLQFMSVSVAGRDDEGNGQGGGPKNLVQGGTQDNGTFQNKHSADDVWPQEIYGDGGNSGINAADDALRVNTFTGQASDVNFRRGAPTKWVVATGAIVQSPEGAYFYPPVVADPNPANGGTIFQGSFSVWRTQDWGGNRDYLEANCPEFTTSAADPNCGDFVPIGPPGNTDLRGPSYGSRAGGAVSYVSRSTAANNLGTAWVATGAGRIFISDNVNAPASSVVFTRIDQTAAASPTRYPSAIWVDPANPHHAWISYSGYNGNTPTTPGHVFDVTWNGTAATWTSLDGTTFPNLPATGLVRDDQTGDLYASTDFGVLRLAHNSTAWTVAGSGLPMVEVPYLLIVPGDRTLYAATHGRSVWALHLEED